MPNRFDSFMLFYPIIDREIRCTQVFLNIIPHPVYAFKCVFHFFFTYIAIRKYFLNSIFKN